MDTNKPTTQPEIGPQIETTKQLAAARQIAAAIEHFHKREFECAITLAAAAEGLLPPTEKFHIFSYLKKSIPPEEFKEANFNRVVNWLKHYKPEHEDPFVFPEYEAINLIMRAISKFIMVCRACTEPMDAYMEWMVIHHHDYPEAGVREEPPKPSHPSGEPVAAK